MAKSSQDRALWRIFRNYKKNAKRRSHAFDISFSVFKKMVLSDCFYCGVGPSSVLKRCNIMSLFNGIDRLKNEYGYTMQNTVTCCAYCNFLKKDFDFTDFIKQIGSISLHLLKYKKR